LPAAQLPSRAKIPGDLAALAILALHGRVAPWNKRVQWERHLLLPLAEPEQPFSFLVGSAQGFHRQFFPRRRESPWHAAYINGFIESALSLEAEPLASTPASSSSSSSSG
jgi:hypothetical protein